MWCYRELPQQRKGDPGGDSQVRPDGHGQIHFDDNAVFSSTTTAYFQRGMTRSEIIARVAEQKARKADLLEFPTTAVSATNGHAAADGMLSYAGAQASKENWLAALRKLEYQKKCGELVPVSYMYRWGVTFLTEARNVLLRGSERLGRSAGRRDSVRFRLRRSHIRRLDGRSGFPCVLLHAGAWDVRP
jgi:hypothetical protein